MSESLKDHPVTLNVADEDAFYEELLRAPEPPDYTPKVLENGFSMDELEAYTTDVIRTLGGQNYKKMEDCEQHSDLWFASRKHRMTGSIIAGVIGVNPYGDYDATCRSLIINDFKGNEATKWGNDNEDFSCGIYEQYMKKVTTDDNFVVEHRGICIHPEVPYFGASPDGVIPKLNLLLEIKNPFYLRHTSGSHPYKKHKDNIPKYYFSQMQFLMECLNF